MGASRPEEWAAGSEAGQRSSNERTEKAPRDFCVRLRGTLTDAISLAHGDMGWCWDRLTKWTMTVRWWGGGNRASIGTSHRLHGRRA